MTTYPDSQGNKKSIWLFLNIMCITEQEGVQLIGAQQLNLLLSLIKLNLPSLGLISFHEPDHIILFKINLLGLKYAFMEASIFSGFGN